jgi:hypothetical protein
MEEYMTESTRLGRARGRMLPVAIVAAALVAMLAIAPFASAASDPITSGTTTLTINNGFSKKAKKAGIKVTAVKPSKLKGTKATFAVTGGEIEPTTGAGTVTHSGGLKITWGKKSVTLKALTIDTKGKSISAKVGGKTVKVASLAGTSTARLGFGASVSAKKVKLTSAGAKALNSKLTPAPTKTKVKKKGKTIVKTVKVQPAFKANMVLGASITEVEPETVAVLPTGTMTFAGDAGVLGKLAASDVKLEVIAPTTAANATTFVSPISGGTISPLGTTGQVNSAGGLKMVQTESLPGIGQPSVTTAITLGSIGVDLAAKTATVEVIGESNFKEPGTTKEPLKLGNLGRSSIADLTITSTPSPATRTVSVSATGTIQAVASEVLNGFVKVHQVKRTEELAAADAKKAFVEALEKGTPITEAEAQKIGEKQGAEEAAAEAKTLEIKPGETLGAFTFLATGE